MFMDDPAAEVDPDLHLRLVGEHLERKMAAMRAQDSQTRRLVEGVGLPTFRRWWGEEAFLRTTPRCRGSSVIRTVPNDALARPEQHEDPLLTLPSPAVRL